MAPNDSRAGYDAHAEECMNDECPCFLAGEQAGRDVLLTKLDEMRDAVEQFAKAIGE